MMLCCIVLLVIPFLVSAQPSESAFEELGFVFRSMADSSVDATDFCATAPFRVDVATGFVLRSISARSSDGAIQDFGKQEIATLEACFNLDGVPAGEFDFYSRAIFLKSGLAFTLDGTCRPLVISTPEPGVNQTNCTQLVVEAPLGYEGGLLVTNSLSPASASLGYNAGSIASLRIFRERD